MNFSRREFLTYSGLAFAGAVIEPRFLPSPEKLKVSKATFAVASLPENLSSQTSYMRINLPDAETGLIIDSANIGAFLVGSKGPDSPVRLIGARTRELTETSLEIPLCPTDSVGSEWFNDQAKLLIYSPRIASAGASISLWRDDLNRSTEPNIRFELSNLEPDFIQEFIVVTLPENIWSKASQVKAKLNDVQTGPVIDGAHIGAFIVGSHGPHELVTGIGLVSRKNTDMSLQIPTCPSTPTGSELLNDSVKAIVFTIEQIKAGGVIMLYQDDPPDPSKPNFRINLHSLLGAVK